MAILQSINIPTTFNNLYHLNAVLADFQYRCGKTTLARINAEQALQKSPAGSIKALLHKRFEQYSIEW